MGARMEGGNTRVRAGGSPCSHAQHRHRCLGSLSQAGSRGGVGVHALEWVWGPSCAAFGVPVPRGSFRVPVPGLCWGRFGGPCIGMGLGVPLPRAGLGVPAPGLCQNQVWGPCVRIGWGSLYCQGFGGPCARAVLGTSLWVPVLRWVWGPCARALSGAGLGVAALIPGPLPCGCWVPVLGGRAAAGPQRCGTAGLWFLLGSAGTVPRSQPVSAPR